MHAPHTQNIGNITMFLSEHEQKDLARILICGSVDDGKSTLIGKLLLDANVLPTDVLTSLEEDSNKYGTVQNGLDPALLTDGLKTEREQNITIDVSYCYFSSDQRSFIIADTPGHEQYTRNMATAASSADLAIILIDAVNGVLPQTRRHTFICSLMGIRHVIVAVNKMDLVAFNEKRFDDIHDEFEAFASKLEIPDVTFVPMSALLGDNVVEKSTHMHWYNGGTLLYLLETIRITSNRNMLDFRLPVQSVCRPHGEYRGYRGTIASGVVRRGDQVAVLPSGQTSRISSIDTFDGSLEQAFASQPVTVTLEDDIDVSRGDVITPVANLTHVGHRFEAMIVWMDAEQLSAGKQYILRIGNAESQATVDTIRYEIDVNTFHRKQDVHSLALNSIGRCVVHASKPVAFDTFARNHVTGSFILIDPTSNATAGAGMILDRLASDTPQKSDQKHYPIFWLTGNTGAGKSTLAFNLKKHFEECKQGAFAEKIVILDGDQMRETISEAEGLSAEDRRKHNLRVARLAKLLQEQGVLVLLSVIAPFSAVRKEIDGICNPLWIYVKRDGLDAPDKPYEAPVNPHGTIDHNVLNKEEALEQLRSIVLNAAQGYYIE